MAEVKASGDLPFVTVYTITYRQKDILEETVQGLFNQDYPKSKYELIVLDDGSNDGTQQLLGRLQRLSPVSLTILETRHEGDYLSAKRFNQCIASASPATKVFIHVEDAFVRADFVLQHVKWHLSKELALVTGAMFEAEKQTWDLKHCRRSFLAAPHGNPVVCDFQAAWAKSLSFTRELMESVWQPAHDKPFDERMVGWGYHETELAWRMKQAGARIVYDPSAGVYHPPHTKSSEQTRGFDREIVKDQGAKKNIEYFCRKHQLVELPVWVQPYVISVPRLQGRTVAALDSFS